MADSLLRRVAVASLILLAACGERELILPGEREAVRPEDESLQPVAATGAALPALRLPAATRAANWTHVNGGPTHLAPPQVLSPAPTRVWSTSIGTGQAKRRRITAAPIVVGDAVFTLDAAVTAGATSTSGRPLWRTSLVPPGERAGESFGGGLAYGDGALIAATGYGEVLRLDPATGRIVWRTRLEGAVRAAPTVVEGRAVVVARGDLAYGVDLATGELDWRVQGTGLGAGLLGGASAAVRGPVAVIPFVSGEVATVLTRSGLTVWNAAVTGGRRGLVRAEIDDISGDPVIDNEIVYVANQGGRMVAFDRRSGERLWTHRNGAYGPVLPLGGSVFMVSDIAELLRLDAETGQVLWLQRLPEWERPDRRRRAIPHFGPLLAGGRLIVASGDGLIRLYDPATGAPQGSVALPGGAASEPAIANGRLYVVSRDGQLHAFQ